MRPCACRMHELPALRSQPFFSCMTTNSFFLKICQSFFGPTRNNKREKGLLKKQQKKTVSLNWHRECLPPVTPSRLLWHLLFLFFIILLSLNCQEGRFMPQDFLSCFSNLELTCSLLSFGLVLALKWNLRFFHSYRQMTTQTRASRILGFQLVRKTCSSALLFFVLVMMRISFPCSLKNNTT